MTSGDLCSPQDTEGQVQGAPNLKYLLCTLRNEDLPRAPVRTQDDFLPSNRRAPFHQMEAVILAQAVP